MSDGYTPDIEALQEHSGATYVNISTVIYVGVPADAPDEQKTSLAARLAENEFAEKFGRDPGMRSDVSAQPTGYKVTDDYSLEKWRVNIVSQTKDAGQP